MNEKVFEMKFINIYNLYVLKAMKKNRTKEEVDTIICWLTGYNDEKFNELLVNGSLTLEQFFANAPKINPKVNLIKGSICGHKIDEIENPLLQKIRYMDKLIDELAKGKKLENILRK